MIATGSCIELGIQLRCLADPVMDNTVLSEVAHRTAAIHLTHSEATSLGETHCHILLIS